MLKITFGQCFELHGDNGFQTNSTDARGTLAIELQPTFNSTGSCKLFSLISGRALNCGNCTICPMPEWVITRVNDMGAAEGHRSIQVVDFRPFSINFLPLPEPAYNSDDEYFIPDLDDNKSPFRDWFSSPSDQRSNDSTLYYGALNITKINCNENSAADEAADTMETNNNSDANANPIDQRSDTTNEDDTSSIFNTPTIASLDDTSDSGFILNDAPENETNANKDPCDMDNEHDNNADDDNIGAQETTDEDNIDN